MIGTKEVPQTFFFVQIGSFKVWKTEIKSCLVYLRLLQILPRFKGLETLAQALNEKYYLYTKKYGGASFVRQTKVSIDVSAHRRL